MKICYVYIYTLKEKERIFLKHGIALIHYATYFLLHHLTWTNLNVANQNPFLFSLLPQPKKVQEQKKLSEELIVMNLNDVVEKQRI